MSWEYSLRLFVLEFYDNVLGILSKVFAIYNAKCKQLRSEFEKFAKKKKSHLKYTTGTEICDTYINFCNNPKVKVFKYCFEYPRLLFIMLYSTPILFFF